MINKTYVKNCKRFRLLNSKNIFLVKSCVPKFNTNKVTGDKIAGRDCSKNLSDIVYQKAMKRVPFREY